MLGTVLCGLSTFSASAVLAASAPEIHVLAIRDGIVVKSALLHRRSGANSTYTGSVSTAVSTSADYRVKTALSNTFLAFSSGTLCDFPLHVKNTVAPVKTAYARIGTATETLSAGCPGGPVTLYGDTYDLKTRHAIGKTDHFASNFTVKFKSAVAKLDLHVTVAIGP
jgi:hypothetical protein